MSSEQHHEELVRGLHDQLKQVFDSSEQGIYLYLDDVHRVCNGRFASMLGYSSPEEWARMELTEKSFPELFADAGSQERLVSAYWDAIKRMVGSAIDVSWKRKAGGKVDTKVILVPLSYQEHLFALHFISEKS